MDCVTLLLFQEKFAEYHVLDAVLGLLCLINSLQLEKLNQQIKTSGDTVGKTVLLETEAELFGGNEAGRPTEEGFITRVVSSPPENVSALAEEGTYCTPDGNRGGQGHSHCAFCWFKFALYMLLSSCKKTSV